MGEDSFGYNRVAHFSPMAEESTEVSNYIGVENIAIS